MRKRLSSYGPTLTDQQRKELEREIRNFDEKRALKEIEKAAKKKPSIQYDTTDELDFVNEADIRPTYKPALDKEVEMAKFEIDEFLTYRQKQCWNLCMRQGFSQEEAAHRLHVRQQVVAEHLEKAEARIKEHFQRKDKTNEK